MFEMSIVDQFRLAVQKQNRLATMAGSIIGGFVPVATFFLVHYGVTQCAWLWLIVLGGLIFSAKTVYEWGRVAFNNGWKSLGFCVLVEGVMTFGNLFYLSCAALGMLALINGVATGCNLALNRKDCNAQKRAAMPAKPKAEKPAPVSKQVASRKKSIRMPKQRIKARKKAA